MSEEIKQNASEEMIEDTTEEKKNEFNADKGELVLSAPIRAHSQDIEVLKYDFSVLTNREYMDALSSDRGASDPFHLTSKQAFNLFCAAAAKCTDDVDATDIRERMNVKDTVFAVQVATVFFAVATRAASTRIGNA